MKIKQAVIYRLKDVKKSILVFYLIVIASYLFISFLASLESVNMTQMSGFEAATMIFLLVTGLNSFKPAFYLFMQNGISRKTMFYSYFISMLVASGIMALIDSIAYTLVGSNRGIFSLFDQLYNKLYEDQLVVKVLVNFIWAWSAYLAFSLIGYFITILYYRMNKVLKLIVSISVPCLLFIVLPIVDTYYNGEISLFIDKAFDFLFGSGAHVNPFASVLSCSLISIIFAVLSFCLARKAVIKKS